MRIKSYYLVFIMIISCGSYKIKNNHKLTGFFIYENEFAYYKINIINDSILELTQNFKCERVPEDVKLQKIRAFYNLEKPIKYDDKDFLKVINNNDYIIIPISVKNLSNNSSKYPYIEKDNECSIFKKENRIAGRLFDGRKIFPIFQENILTSFDEVTFEYNVQSDELYYMKTFKRDTL